MHLLFDIGGTNMRFAVSDGKRLDKIRIFPTPKDFDAAINLFKKSTSDLPPGKLQSIVGGVPRFTKQVLSFWHTNPTEKILRKISKAKVVLTNDAEIAGLGEAVYGAGKGHNIVAYLTYSTGFGGSRIVNKKIDANSLGYEPCLQIVQYNPAKKSSTPISQFVTGRGIYDRYKKNPEKIKNKKVWSEVENWMGVTIVNSSIFWSPDIVVVGGAVGLNKNISADRINKRIKEVFSLMPKIPLVKKAELGQLSGLYGALAMAKQNRR